MHSGILNQKATKSFFSIHPICDWGKIIYSNFIPTTKTWVFWKLLHRCLLIDLDAKNRGVSLCSMCSLCWLEVDAIDNLFFNFSIIFFIWSYLQNIFTNLTNLSFTNFITFIKAPHSPLIHLVKLFDITFSICMIWRMRNVTRFQ